MSNNTTDATPDTDQNQSQTVTPEWVAETANAVTAEPAEDVSVGHYFTSEAVLRQEATKSGLPTQGIPDAVEAAEDEGLIIAHAGRIAPVDPDHLRATAAAEGNSTTPRSHIIAKCNAARLAAEAEAEAEAEADAAGEAPADD